MATQVTYVGDGATVTYAIPFDYSVDGSDLNVTVDASPVPFNLDNASTLRLSSAPSAGAGIRVFRKTPFENPEVVFADSSILSADDLNNASGQLFRRVQEVADDTAAVAGRSLLTPEGEVIEALPSAAERAGGALVFDASGKPSVKSVGSFPVGPSGPANSTYATLSDLKDAKPSNLSFILATPNGPVTYAYVDGDFTGKADDVAVVGLKGTPISKGALVRQSAASLTFRHPRSAYARQLQDKAAEVISAADFGAARNGTANDSAPLLAAVVAARLQMGDGLRAFAGEVRLPPGRYRIEDVLQLAPPGGVAGLTVTGAGAGSTEIVFSNSAATIKCSGSRGVTFRDLTFRSVDPTVDGPASVYGIDMNQTAFTIEHTGIPLRSWRFERCDFAGFYRCFKVTGYSMCSEFFFDKCQFSQCYQLMNNDNDQAVNWNFINCNWENEALDTVKDKNLSSAFFLQAGTHVKWTGGSLIFWGSLVYFNLVQPNSFQSTSHAITFEGVRIELVDGGAGTHAPFVNRVEVGYATGGNSPVLTMKNCTVINRGAIPPTTVYSKLWNNCNFVFENCQLEGGRVVGILDGLTTAQNGTLRIINTSRLDYSEDSTNRAGDHDAHAVTIVPPLNGAEGALITDVRPSTLLAMASIGAKHATVRGPTGSIPLSGTSVNVGRLPIHTVLSKLYIKAFETFGAPFSVELRDQADTTTFALVSIGAGAKTAEADIAKEVGFQVPDVPLMLKFGGTPQIIKGIVGMEYL